MLLKEFSQILSATGDIYASQEKQILSDIISIIEEQPQNHHEEEEYIKKPWNILGARIEEFPSGASPDVVYNHVISYQMNMAGEYKEYRNGE